MEDVSASTVRFAHRATSRAHLPEFLSMVLALALANIHDKERADEAKK